MRMSAAFLPISHFLNFHMLQIISQTAAHWSASLCSYLQVYFCLFLCQITDLCFVLIVYSKFTLLHFESGVQKPSGSEGINLSFVSLLEHLSWCYSTNRKITFLITNAQWMGSATATDQWFTWGCWFLPHSLVPGKPLSEGSTTNLVQMNAAWPSYKVPNKEDASTNTHPDFCWSGWKGMGRLEK